MTRDKEGSLLSPINIFYYIPLVIYMKTTIDIDIDFLRVSCCQFVVNAKKRLLTFFHVLYGGRFSPTCFLFLSKGMLSVEGTSSWTS
jgi:hypothetical protein